MRGAALGANVLPRLTRQGALVRAGVGLALARLVAVADLPTAARERQPPLAALAALTAALLPAILGSARLPSPGTPAVATATTPAFSLRGRWRCLPFTLGALAGLSPAATAGTTAAPDANTWTATTTPAAPAATRATAARVAPGATTIPF